MSRSEAITDGIRVEVNSFYVPERSDPPRDLYYFAYKVVISNEGGRPAQLVTRHWVITDGNGDVEHVRGPGVVGEQPRLEPGESFEYTSACPLSTSQGSMRGTYQMVRDDGEPFEAEIAPFTLALPHSLN
ncbi:MAG: Co2+/Mg2+ efflux protein ApaG [Acidobacteria bacterium]|nr:Co2+/Mg2+ efflux protein ApaG [Acidobacteriota bacterium]